jgi:hypothetical protein
MYAVDRHLSQGWLPSDVSDEFPRMLINVIVWQSAKGKCVAVAHMR